VLKNKWVLGGLAIVVGLAVVCVFLQAWDLLLAVFLGGGAATATAQHINKAADFDDRLIQAINELDKTGEKKQNAIDFAARIEAETPPVGSLEEQKKDLLDDIDDI